MHKHIHLTFYQSRHWMIIRHVDIIHIRLYLWICIWIYVPTCNKQQLQLMYTETPCCGENKWTRKITQNTQKYILQRATKVTIAKFRGWRRKEKTARCGNLSQQMIWLILLDFNFPYCGLGRGVVGSKGFSRFPSPHSNTHFELVGSDNFVPKSIFPTVTGKQISENHFTYRSVQYLKFISGDSFSRIWSSAEDYAVLCLLLNTVVFLISVWQKSVNLR